MTTRDDLDRQQPFNLRIPGTNTQTTGADGTIYDVSHLQLFQADQLRGYYWDGDGAPPDGVGRRVIAQHLHDSAAMAANLFEAGAPPNSVTLGADGSMAAFVPAQRAMSWQLTDAAGNGVVRERYWLTFQPGEVRVCASCHGLNEHDQAGQPMPTNPPEALVTLLEHWQNSGCRADNADCSDNYLPMVSSSVVTQQGQEGDDGNGRSAWYTEIANSLSDFWLQLKTVLSVVD